jgi:hypothetical protein
MLSLVQIKCARSSTKIPYVVMILKNKHGGHGQCLFLLAETNEYLRHSNSGWTTRWAILDQLSL